RKNINVRNSLRASFKDGIFAALMGGVTDHYATPLALSLGATIFQVGLVSALPNLLSSLSQFFAVRIIYWVGGRIKLLVRLVFSQAAMLLAIAFLAAFPDALHRVELFLVLLTVAALCGGLAGPAWGSLMSDYIPASKRGQYFGWRSSVLGAVSITSVCAAGVVLYLFRQLGFDGGFVVLFCLAALFRYISGHFINQMDEPPHRKDPASDFTFVMFIARFQESNFLKFVFFAAALNFASFLAAPFFAVFMLRDLQLNYLTYMALQVSSSLMALLALPLWGRHADLVGNASVLRLSSLLAALIPFFWLASHNPLYLVFVQLWAGFAWSGVTLSTGNFIYDAVTPQKRVRCISYFNVINGVAVFLGSATGGWLASRLPPLAGFQLLGLFMLSGVCRFLACIVLSARFREVRRAREVSLRDLFYSVVGIRPLMGPAQD
ncbi:MAG: MFS transporter, partial [Deltaproteobacteria bacterium]|nr:MFS transporter [Deltaproteobacteria bacterium]